MFLMILKRLSKQYNTFSLIVSFPRFSLRSSVNGGDGTCRGFWEQTPNTTSPRWRATALTSPWWPKAAPAPAVPPPARTTFQLSDRSGAVCDYTQKLKSVCSTHTVTCSTFTIGRRRSWRNCSDCEEKHTDPGWWWWFVTRCIFISSTFIRRKYANEADWFDCFFRLLNCSQSTGFCLRV